MSKASHIDPNARVRGVMSERGDNGETPRHATFYFYGGDVEGLAAAARRAGYETQPITVRKGIVLHTNTAVDEASFAVHAQRMESWALEFASDYDGWECQLMIQ